MPSVVVQITRVIDDDYPIFIEFTLTDADGKLHLFHDKLPIIDAAPDKQFDPTGKLGELPCTVIEHGDDLAVIDTTQPASVASTEDQTEFRVSAELIRP